MPLGVGWCGMGGKVGGWQKVSKLGLPNQTSKIWHIFADISGVQAGLFEYYEPDNPNDFFSSLLKGSEPFWGVR